MYQDINMRLNTNISSSTGFTGRLNFTLLHPFTFRFFINSLFYILILSSPLGYAKNATKNKQPTTALNDLQQIAQQEIDDSIQPTSSNKSSSKSSSQSVQPSGSDAFLVARPEELSQAPTSNAWILSLGIENLAPQGSIKSSGLDPILLDGFRDEAAVLVQLNWWMIQKANIKMALAAGIAWQQRSYNLQLPGLGIVHQTKLDVFRPAMTLKAQTPIKRWIKNYNLYAGFNIGTGKFFQVQSSGSSNLLNVSKADLFWEIGPQISLDIHQSFYVNLEFSTRAALSSSYERTYHGILSAGLPF